MSVDQTPQTRTIETIRFTEPIAYRAAYKAQIERRNAVERGEAPNALFLLEHTPILTLGRKASEEHLLQSRNALEKIGVDVCDTDRGGDVTYHGPGQLVAYPVLNLMQWRQSIRWYLRSLEQVLIDLLAEYRLEAERVEGLTGVWVDGAKVAAIGIGVHNWVTFHGIALNVAPNMEHWSLIVPCGIPDKPVTSLERLLGSAPSMDEVSARFERRFRDYFLSRDSAGSIQ